MHASVIAVWRYRFAGLPGDVKLVDRKLGLLVPVSEDKNRKPWNRERKVFNGMPGYAEIEGRPNRMLMQFEEASGEFVFPEMFRQNAWQRREKEAADRLARKAERDRRYRASVRIAQDSKERAEVPPDEAIVPFPVRMGA